MKNGERRRAVAIKLRTIALRMLDGSVTATLGSETAGGEVLAGDVAELCDAFLDYDGPPSAAQQAFATNPGVHFHRARTSLRTAKKGGEA